MPHPATCSPLDSPANPTVSPVSAKRPPTTATSGVNVSEPLAYFDPHTRCWRTFQASLLASLDGSSTECFQTWPRSGTWDATTFSAQPSAARPTSGNVSGSWPTPRTITGGAESAERKQELGRTESGGGDLQAASESWATPRAEDGERGQGSQFDGLSEDVTAWATPKSRDFKDGTSLGAVERQSPDLGKEVVTFATPGPTPSPTVGPMAPSDSSPPEPWPTVTVADGGMTDGAPRPSREATGRTTEYLARTVAQFEGKKKSRGLNPRFALWLQGFPVTWLDATPPKKGRKK